jgi:hypothetical protein
MQPGGVDQGPASIFAQQAVPSAASSAVANPLTAAPAVVGDTQSQIGNLQPNFESPEVLAARTAMADAQAATAQMQNQLNAPAVSTVPAAAPGAAPAPTAPKLMTLSDYDTWMKELYNQKMYQDYGGNLKFRDPSQGSWTDWLKAHGDRPSQARPVFHIGGGNYGAAGQTTMIDPTTGIAQGPGGGVRYAGYGAAYRPQTGNYAKDWAITNMVRGGGAAPSLAGSATAPVGSATVPAVAPPSAPPVRPAGNITWQQDQQYWRDLDTYNKLNKLGTYR